MAEILVEKLGVPALYLANKVGFTRLGSLKIMEYDTHCTALYQANKVGHFYSDVCHDWLWWQDVNDKNDNYFDDYDDNHFDVNDDENANLMTIDNYDDNWQLWWWRLTIMMTVMMKITILQAVMSLYGGGQMTGVAVDSGQVSFNFNSIFNSDGDMAFSEIFDA